MKLLLISIIIHILSNIAFGMHFLSSKSLNGHGSWKCFHQKTFGYTYRHSFQFLEMRVICCPSSEGLNSRSNFYLRLAQIPCKIERNVMLAYAIIHLRILFFFWSNYLISSTWICHFSLSLNFASIGCIFCSDRSLPSIKPNQLPWEYRTPSLFNGSAETTHVLDINITVPRVPVDGGSHVVGIYFRIGA